LKRPGAAFVGPWSILVAGNGKGATLFYARGAKEALMRPVLLAAVSLAALLIMAACESNGTRSARRWGAPDPQTIASITQGPDMITPAGSSQKRARAELDSNLPALAQTVTAKRWHELRNQ